MNKTKIEWTDYTWNPITGCKHGCPYCYARKITARFPKNFPRGFEPCFYHERLNEPLQEKRTSKIFTVSMGDMFGEWIPELWQNLILNTIDQCPHHQFQILTKAPRNIHRHIHSWPKNVWIGTSLTGGDWPSVSQERILAIKRHKGIKFVSFEPLLNEGSLDYIDLCGINWVIIGAQTNPLKLPKEGWVKRIIDMANESNAAVFVKDNILRNYRTWYPQDFPTTSNETSG